MQSMRKPIKRAAIGLVAALVITGIAWAAGGIKISKVRVQGGPGELPPPALKPATPSFPARF